MTIQSFPSKAAQKDALYQLTKVLRTIRDQHHNLFLARDRVERSYDKDALDVYYGFPDSIGSLKPSHIAKADKFYPQFTKELHLLMTERDTIKATPVVKPVSKVAAKREAVEQIIRDRGSNDSLKTELLKIAPRLEANFKSWVIDVYSRTPDARYIARFVRHTPSRVLPRETMLDVEALARYAKQYGIDTATVWYGKMAAKLGAATKVSVVQNQLSSDVTIIGEIEGHNVTIKQQIVFKVSSRGNRFHQFPALIYVDGFLTTEAEFAERFHRVAA